MIVATRNSIATLPAALASVAGFCDRVKLFFVDGGSTDGTLDCIQSYVQDKANAVFLSQQVTGLYQAMNQGIQAAIEDPVVTHIGLLHGDDYLLAGAFERYLAVIAADSAPVFYSDIEFHNASGKRVRVWRSGEFSKLRLATGWMPPHTSIVAAKYVYQKLGLYGPNFGTAADYEWIVRVLSEYGERLRYFPESILSMRVGGASSLSLKARLRANAMDGKVWADKSRLGSMLVRLCKPLRKIGQFRLI